MQTNTLEIYDVVMKYPNACEARSVETIPIGDNWHYEPKWDGFRCLLYRQDQSVVMRSKSGEDLARYFPEVVLAALALPARQFGLDGELVILHNKGLSFDALLQRIHPAASRVRRLADETPAMFIAFDLLNDPKLGDLLGRPLIDRRTQLEAFAARTFGGKTFALSRKSDDVRQARRWLASAGGGCDGVIAKRLDLPYQAGSRDGMQKIKHFRSADCVIGGFRYNEKSEKQQKLVGSLLLGLYDDKGHLHHIGFTSAPKSNEKPDLTKRMTGIATDKSFDANIPGGPSRWSRKRSTEWQPVEPKLVVEVSYDHFSGGRFRHGTSIVRWRPDKRGDQCTFEQLHQKTLDVRRLLVTPAEET